MAYDPGGRVQSRTDANARTTTYTYDTVDRLTRVAYFDGTSVAYAYDAANRRTSMADATGTTTYAYDNADHLTLVTPPAGGSVQYGWDNAGRLARVTHRAGARLRSPTGSTRPPVTATTTPGAWPASSGPTA